MNSPRDALRLGAGILCREPGFALTAVLMLALGIGSTTAIFSIVNGVLLTPLPYANPNRLVSVREVNPAWAHLYPFLSVNPRHFVEWRAQCRSFEALGIADGATMSLTEGQPERIDGAVVTSNLFRLLGVRPAIGRDFLEEEEQPGRNRVAILTDGFWRRRFAADASVVGKSIALDGRQHLVVGILPPGFRLITRNTFGAAESMDPPAEVFRPLSFNPRELTKLVGEHNYTVVGRLKRGATYTEAKRELEAVQAQLVKMSGEKMEYHADVRPMLDLAVGNAGPALLTLLSAVGMVLLIACVNLANLFLALGERRARDTAVRTALGATRARLVRQAMSEALLLAVAGGTLGILVGVCGVRLLVRSAPANIPRLGEVSIDARALLFGLAVTLATSVLFGLLPAWRNSRADPQEALKAGGRGASGSRSGMRLRNTLVTVEVALSTALLISAGLLMNSFARLMRADKGFDAPSVLAVDVSLPPVRYDRDRRNDFYTRLTERLASQPGIWAGGVASALPLEGENWIVEASVPGQDPRTGPSTNLRLVSADYFRAMGIPLRAGRTFSPNDRNRKVAVLSEQLAAALWPHQDAVGRRVVRDGRGEYEVIGVVADVRAEPHKPPVAVMYWPYWETAPEDMTVVARAAGNPRSIAGALRTAIRSLAPDVPVSEMRTMSQVLDNAVATRRYNMLLAVAFACTALLLASLGIYGVISFAVARRTGEMGVRAALGARPARLYGLILRQGMTPVLAGLALGSAASLAFGRVLASMLYEVNARDPLTIVSVAALVAAVAATACYVPARRAAHTDPTAAIRLE